MRSGNPTASGGADVAGVDRARLDPLSTGEVVGPVTDLAQGPTVGVGMMPVTVEHQQQSLPEVGRELGGPPPQHVAVLEQGRQQARQPGMPRLHDHPGQAGVGGNPGHPQPELGRMPVVVERPQSSERGHAVGPVLGRGLIEERNG